MIYSPDINKVCAVCQKSHYRNENEMYCDIKMQAVPINSTACGDFQYDILKRAVKRKPRLRTSYNAEDFAL